MLIGTRNGDILEIDLLPELKGLAGARSEITSISSKSNYREMSQPSTIRNRKEKISDIKFDVNLLLRNHSIQMAINANNTTEYFLHKKVHMSAHPTMNVLVTIGNDKMLCLWNTTNMELMDRINLGVVPTCVKWSPDGTLLVVGFFTGILKIYESKAVKTVYGRYKNSKGIFDFFLEYDKPVLEDIDNISDKNIKTSVLNIEFSSVGELMAVSYDNQKINKEEDQTSKNKDGSFVIVYVHRDSRLKTGVNTNDDGKIYIRHFEIICPSINETYENKNNVYGMAVYFMAFSSDDKYLMVYFQIIDNFQIRQNKDREGNYIVWNTHHDTPVKDWDGQKDAVFKAIKFPNHIYGKYQFYEGNLQLSSKDNDEKYLSS